MLEQVLKEHLEGHTTGWAALRKLSQHVKRLDPQYVEGDDLESVTMRLQQDIEEKRIVLGCAFFSSASSSKYTVANIKHATYTVVDLVCYLRHR